MLRVTCYITRGQRGSCNRNRKATVCHACLNLAYATFGTINLILAFWATLFFLKSGIHIKLLGKGYSVHVVNTTSLYVS